MNLINNASMKNLCETIEVDEIYTLLEFPMYFEIETAHICNARCRICTIDTWPERKAFMSDDIFNKIASDIRGYAQYVRRCTLCRDGEPLLDRKLESKIAMLKAYGIKHVVISTNASLLSEERIKSVLDSGLDEIMFSVDGFTKKTFEEIRTGLDYGIVIGNILDFLSIREHRNSKMKVRIRMILQRLNAGEFSNWQYFWRSKVRDTDMVYAKPIHSWGNQLDISGFVRHEDQDAGKACTALWSTMIVHSDGTVPACSVDYKNKYLSGNVADSDIRALWQSNVLNNLRELHSQGRRDTIEICRNCFLWDKTKIIF